MAIDCSGATDVIKVLISARANLHATSANGKTALEIAIINGNRKECHSALEVLEVASVASVLEIALGRRGAPAQSSVECS